MWIIYALIAVTAILIGWATYDGYKRGKAVEDAQAFLDSKKWQHDIVV